MTMPDQLRHAHHVGNPDPRCEVCLAKARDRMAGVPVRTADQVSVRAVGGFVQTSGRFVG